MNQHFIGATYDLTQDNMNKLISELEYNLERKKQLAAKLVRQQERIDRVVTQLARAEGVLASVAMFGNEDLLDDHDYQGSGHEARDYFDSAYGLNYCATRDAGVRLAQEEYAQSWKEIAANEAHKIFTQAAELKKEIT